MAGVREATRDVLDSHGVTLKSAIKRAGISLTTGYKWRAGKRGIGLAAWLRMLERSGVVVYVARNGGELLRVTTDDVECDKPGVMRMPRGRKAVGASAAVAERAKKRREERDRTRTSASLERLLTHETAGTADLSAA